MKARFYILLALCLGFAACQSDSQDGQASAQKSDNASTELFELLSAKQTGINFENQIEETEEMHYFKFLYMYNGAGVATADINNDGLQDIYFNSNQGANKLFLNKGDFQFEDITGSAGVSCAYGYKTGVCFADVNGDGWQDIYVSKYGLFNQDEANVNNLYINNGNLTFTESAAKYGLDETYNTTQTSFFDYDQDGDLDAFLLNTPSDFSVVNEFFEKDDLINSSKGDLYKGRDKLYENRDGKFVDVSNDAGFIKDVSFGLSVLTADLNHDGLIDVYVGNDFRAPDYAYKNNGDGTFTEVGDDWFGHLSFYTMGADVGDINNDTLSDLFVMDMMPLDYVRSKRNMDMVNAKTFNRMVNHGFHYQYMHNVLQLNSGEERFSDVAQLTGLDRSDWSWTCLLSDLDNDGYKDAYIGNGIPYDVTNQDHELFILNKRQELGRNLTYQEKLEFIESKPIANLAFRNKGGLDFENVSEEWNLNQEAFTNGVALVDLDNDGDNDMVTNNLGSNAFVYKNNSKNNYLKVKFKGKEPNNVKLTLNNEDGQSQYQEILHSRGFLSGSSTESIFGLGDSDAKQNLAVVWPDGKVQNFKDLEVNQTLEVDYSQAIAETSIEPEVPLAFAESSDIIKPAFEHEEIPYHDFWIQVLLPHKFSQSGPFISSADVNGDKREDFFISGSSDFASTLYLQQANGSFKKSPQAAFEADKKHEDLGNVFFDADNDGDQDLYVVSGGSEHQPKTDMYQDRLYLNNGRGKFTKSKNALPVLTSSCQSVTANDFDGDGDMDLFVGGRIWPNHYPFPTLSYLLENEDGQFSEVAGEYAKDTQLLGAVASSVWADIDDDGDDDLLVVGEWMAIKVFKNNGGFLDDATAEYGLENSTGWWNKIVADDLDNDGDIDFVIGNLGLNHKFKASMEKPMHLYSNDFDNNGTIDVMLAKEHNGKQVPVRGRKCTSQQMPFIKGKFPTYESYAHADLNAILGSVLQQSVHLEAKIFESIILENDGGKLKIKKLPREAQLSAVNGIVVADINQDGNKDLILGGNMYHTEVETSRADASVGCVLIGDGKNQFSPQSPQESGLLIPGDVKDLKVIQQKNRKLLLVANNDDKLQTFVFK